MFSDKGGYLKFVVMKLKKKHIHYMQKEFCKTLPEFEITLTNLSF